MEKGTGLVKRRRILYIQHASALGGSCISLLYTLQALDRTRFDPVVALIRPTPEVTSFYENAGFETLAWPGIDTFQHTTAHWWPMYSPSAWRELIGSLVGWRQSQQRTVELISAVRPDLVHLNSSVLVPSALALETNGIPFVWHIREAPIQGHIGVRRNWLRHLLLSLGKEVIFLSEDDQRRWVGGKRGVIVHNFVNFRRFGIEAGTESVYDKLHIPKESRVILYVGGFQEIKGIFPLLDALALVRQRYPDVVLLMPGAHYVVSAKCMSRVIRKGVQALDQHMPPGKWMSAARRVVLPLTGSSTLVQFVNFRLRDLHLHDAVRCLPFQTDLGPLIAASEFLVFPSIRPHFARPVIEAAAIGRPSIGSDIGGVNELISNEQTGLLVPPGDPIALAKAMIRLLDEPKLAHELGENAYQVACQRFDAPRQIEKIMEIYARALGE